MHSVLNPEAPEFHPYLTSTVQDGYLQMSSTVRSSNRFPTGTSYDLFKTFTDFGIVTCKISENVVIQSNQIMVKELPAVKLKCDGDEQSNTEKIIDANDSFLDRINVNMDTLSGVNQPSEEFLRGAAPAAWNRAPVLATIKVNGGSATLIGSKNIPRPQVLFKEPVDNSDQIFVPRIHDKPNNIKPLALNIKYNDEGKPIGYEHPYEMELALYQPPERALQAGEPPAFPPPLDHTPLTLVETEPQLDLLVLHLADVNEIAVDLEHHSYRTYQGITCLIQISTDEGGDFIVDALAVREHLHKLNQCFTDPDKIKVFHGAEKDVQWLQRDFGVYVVGMFDTYQAARALRLGGLSLKYLLQRYCRVDTDKAFQLADWRMRPLPAELVEYARADTHYLLYIWRCMRRELLAADPSPPLLLRAVFDNSTLVCGMTYNKVTVHEESHMPLYIRSQKRFTVAQMTALRLMYRWRDRQARDLDESTTYLLPNHMLLALADRLPRDLEGLHAVCRPMPPFVKQNIDTLHRMILSCRELPDQPRLYRIPASVMQMMTPPSWQQFSFHDLSHFPEVSDEPINLEATWQVACTYEVAAADVRLFDESPPPRDRDHPPAATDHPHKESQLNAEAQMFIPPFDRYRMYRMISQAKELADLKEKEARVAAISRNNELIRKEVLEPLEQAHAEIKHEGEPAAQPDPPAEPGAGAPHLLHKRAAQRKRKIIEKTDQKEAANQTLEKKNSRNTTAALKPFYYKNANYKMFHSHNDKGHKHQKMK